MPKIAVIAIKGGVGKTAISMGLASTLWAQGETVTLIDADPQEGGSSTDWLRGVSAVADDDRITWVPAKSGTSALIEVGIEDSDGWVIVDTPRASLADPDVVTLARQMDLVIIPTSGNGPDVKSAAQTAYSLPPNTMIVFARVDSRRLSEAYRYRNQLVETGFRVAGICVRELAAIPHAYSDGHLPTIDDRTAADFVVLASEVRTAITRRA